MMMSSPGPATHRTRLLAAARELLRERAYGDITARDLVAASDTNLGSIGYHFGSKEALLNEAIGLALEEWAETIIGLTSPAQEPAPLAWLGPLRAVLDDYESIRPYYQAFIEALARSARSPALRRQLADHYNRQRDRVASWLTAASSGAITPQQARHLSSVLIGAVDGLLIQSFIDPGDVPAIRDLAASCAKAGTAYGQLAGEEPAAD